MTTKAKGKRYSSFDIGYLYQRMKEHYSDGKNRRITPEQYAEWGRAINRDVESVRHKCSAIRCGNHDDILGEPNTLPRHRPHKRKRRKEQAEDQENGYEIQAQSEINFDGESISDETKAKGRYNESGTIIVNEIFIPDHVGSEIVSKVIHKYKFTPNA